MKDETLTPLTSDHARRQATLRREWAMPNKHTFSIPVIRDFVKRYAGNGEGWADPFAGSSRMAEYTNDLNPQSDSDDHKEALDFMQDLRHQLKHDDCQPNGDPTVQERPQLQGVIFDPPYSLTQVSRSYNDIGLKFKGKENPTGGFPKVRDEISEMVVPGGYVLSFGWNTVGMGKKRGFEIVEILIVCHGGNRNDTLCVAERRVACPQRGLWPCGISVSNSKSDLCGLTKEKK